MMARKPTDWFAALIIDIIKAYIVVAIIVWIFALIASEWLNS